VRLRSLVTHREHVYRVQSPSVKDALTMFVCRASRVVRDIRTSVKDRMPLVRSRVGLLNYFAQNGYWITWHQRPLAASLQGLDHTHIAHKDQNGQCGKSAN
jgi:hypothetical protein